MDDIKRVAEKLASAVILNEAAAEALADEGFIKLAETPWLAPLVGAGLGAAGGGLAGYLSSPEVEDAKKTHKRIIAGLLGGGGIGAGLGAVVHGLDPETSGKGSTHLPPPKYEGYKSMPMSERLATGWNSSHPLMAIPTWLAGGSAKGVTEKSPLLGGTGLLARNVGEWVDKFKGMQLGGEARIVDKARGLLDSRNGKPVQSLITQLQSMVNDASPQKKGKPKGPAGTPTSKPTGSAKNVNQAWHGAHKDLKEWEWGREHPDSMTLPPGTPKTPEELAQLEKEVAAAVANGKMHSSLNPVWALNNKPDLKGLKAKATDQPMAASLGNKIKGSFGLDTANPEANPLISKLMSKVRLTDRPDNFVNKFMGRIGMGNNRALIDAKLLEAAKKLPEANAINPGGYYDPGTWERYGRRMPKGVAAALTLPGPLGAAMYNTYAPGQPNARR